MRSVLATLLALAFACLADPAGALAGNDSWNTPDDLFFSAAGSATTTAYGVEPGEPVSAQDTCPARGATAWWRVKGTGQPITISTAEAGTNFNTVIVVLTGTPLAASRVACNDDAAGDVLHRSRVTFNSVRGTSYLVQVGGRDACSPTLNPCPETGTVFVRASAPRPANDDRIAAAVLADGVPATASNLGAGQEPAEDTTCAGTRFAATIWYRWSAPATGDATFQASASFTPVLAVYRADSGARVACDTGAQTPGRAQLALRVTAGDYLLQVGAPGTEGVTPIGEGAITGRVDFAADADQDSSSGASDCNDHDPSIHPGATEIPGDGIDQDCDGHDAAVPAVVVAAADADRDHDGFPQRVDCDDADPKRHPGATDVPANGIDENCDGHDAAWPALGAVVSTTWLSYPGYTRFLTLAVTRLPAGATITVTCRGHGCPFKTTSRAIRKATRRFDLAALVRHARLRRGAALEVRVSKVGTVGVVSRWQIRSPAKPKRVDECLTPGKAKPTRC